MTLGFTDIASLLASGARDHGPAIALEDEAGQGLTYRDLHAVTARIAASLSGAVQAKPGRRPRFGIVYPNGADIAVVLLGASLAGEATPFNSVSTAAEFATYFAATGIDALIVRTCETGPAVEVAQAAGLPILRVAPDYAVIGAPATGPAPIPAGGDVALVLMTSGSTGQPKIVPLTHRNVCCSADEVARSMALGPQDICLTMWEQFHIGGLVDLLLAPLTSGGRVIATGGFNAARFYALLESRKPTWYQAVPTTLNELVFHAERQGLTPQPNSLRLIRSVAAALSVPLVERVVDLFGVPVVRTFGMTEASPLITTTPLPPLPQKPGSVGKSWGTEIAILGPDGPLRDHGATGEVAIRGDNVFAGYEGAPDLNAQSFRDGWFLTGDLGYLDAEGDLFLTGRIKQLINRGGEKISPQEVDDVLAAHPAVAEVATFAIKHRTLGEDIAAAIVRRAPVEAAALRAFVRQSLAPFKVPQRILFLDALPRNPVGKIDRLALAKLAEAEPATASASFTAPRTPLEHLLAVLWAIELNLPQVDVLQDFTEAGGDSLSMTRLLLATEAALGCQISPDLFADNSTIAAIAEHLAASAPALGTDLGVIEARATESLGQVHLGSVGFEDSVAELAATIETCSDRTRLRTLTEGVIAYATAAEINAMLQATTAAEIGAKADQTQGLIDRFRLDREYRQWRRELQGEVTAHARDRAWLRRGLCESALLYGDPTVPAARKTLVVGFTGNLGRLMQPTYRILTHLDPRQFDLLLLRDPSKSLFVSGAAGLGSSLPAVTRAVDDLFRRGGYAAIVALGTSGGGPAALYGALVHGWHKAVAICTPGPAVHPGLGPLLAEAVAQAGQSPCPALLVHSDTDRDRLGAQEMQRAVPFATLELRTGYSTHNLIHEAHTRDQLAGLLADWVSPVSDLPTPGKARSS